MSTKSAVSRRSLLAGVAAGAILPWRPSRAAPSTPDWDDLAKLIDSPVLLPNYPRFVNLTQPENLYYYRPAGEPGAPMAGVRPPKPEAIAKAVDGDLRPATIYELGGPDVRTFKELMQYVLVVTQRRRLLVPVPFAVMKLQAMILQFLPKPPITPDQVELLKRDNVVSEDAKRDKRVLEGIGITPESIEAIVPTYLWRFRKTGQFNPHVAQP